LLTVGRTSWGAAQLSAAPAPPTEPRDEEARQVDGVVGQGVAADPDPAVRSAAEQRVGGFLDGFAVALTPQRDMVIRNCMARALEYWRAQPEADLERLAIEQAEEALAAWFVFILSPERVGEHPPLLVGRMAYHLCGGSARWPGVSLDYDRVPPDFVAAMRAAVVAPTPAEEPRAMVEQSLQPWSLVDLVAGLRVLVRWSRGLIGRPAPAS
jgi:hypothetical protein